MWLTGSSTCCCGGADPQPVARGRAIPGTGDNPQAKTNSAPVLPSQPTRHLDSTRRTTPTHNSTLALDSASTQLRSQPLPAPLVILSPARLRLNEMPSGSTAMLSPPPARPTPLHTNSFSKSKSTTTTRRPRSSSIVSVQEVVDTYDDGLDAGALTNVSTSLSKLRPNPSCIRVAIGSCKGGCQVCADFVG